MNVSADNPVCILLKFTYTNTETWSRLKVLTIVVMWWNIHMLETETLQSDTPNLEEQNVVCQVLHKFKFVLRVLFELALKLSGHKLIFSTTATTTHFQNVTNYKSVSPQCSGLIEK